MKKKLFGVLILGTIVLVVILSLINGKVNGKVVQKVQIKAYQQHIEAMENGADPSLGLTELPANFVVDGQFESHLPLVVIDINGETIRRMKHIIEQEDGSQLILYEEGDPFTYGEISVIDNADYHNRISDVPATFSKMKIRLRGSSSQSFDKKQYAIKMLTEEGTARKVNVMGMGANNDWILNISMLDGSLMRNYTAMMFGSALFPGTPDCRYCEVVMKLGEDSYAYLGVYLMMEKIERGKGRVELPAYHPGDEFVSYLLCRDREDSRVKQLSTYGNLKNLTYGRLSVLYPEEDCIDEDAFSAIEKEIDTIDRVLYSDDLGLFNTWTEYLDERSFVDYFVFNSIFRNYDAGNNSTYMYKVAGGKLCMGPVWDYDNACNNDYNDIQIPDHLYFNSHPYFDRLMFSKRYVDALKSRYEELTRGIFSAENIRKYTNEVADFLGNAALRDWQRWYSHYGPNSSYSRSYGIVDSQGFVVDRRTEEFREEVLRYQNYFLLEEQFMEENLDEYSKHILKQDVYLGSYFVLLFCVAIICAIVVISRRKMFR